MDWETMTCSLSILITVYINMLWVRKRNVSLRRFFYQPKFMFGRKTTFNNQFWGLYSFMFTSL